MQNIDNRFPMRNRFGADVIKAAAAAARRNEFINNARHFIAVTFRRFDFIFTFIAVL